ncbi:hypothetical protein ABI_39980 [Asticcacaulis biprosthecium C19]|uniref:Uncharacterized protein n=1 Tax=Asticcacaulis biprosthecium C19 TaxID=715226 RepID=F4QS61_9CAUL|nr:protealysin inhibitor emfourin [Asticcacaulis biprosthecium]EGF89581.1 hypothetical protein ABI_39980 [Asticcacaulis biprosthecium C19]
MKITAQTQGGLGGPLALRPFARSLDVDALTAEEQAQIRTLIVAALQGGGVSPTAEATPDGMLRRLIVEDGDVSHTFTAPDADADPAFVTLWNWVHRKAR